MPYPRYFSANYQDVPASCAVTTKFNDGAPGDTTTYEEIVTGMPASMGLFGTDPAMLETGAHYLRIVGPSYGFFGLGIVLYFASLPPSRPVQPIPEEESP